MTESNGKKISDEFDKAVLETAAFFSSLEVPAQNSEGSYDLLSPYADPPLLAARAKVIFGDWQSLVDAAKTDHSLFEGLKLLVAERLEAKDGLPVPAMAWLIGYLIGTNKPPRKPTGRPISPEYFDLAIFDQVQRLVDQGFNPTRAATASPESALDVVADAMRLNRHHLSEYEAIRKACARGKAVMLSLI